MKAKSTTMTIQRPVTIVKMPPRIFMLIWVVSFAPAAVLVPLGLTSLVIPLFFITFSTSVYFAIGKSRKDWHWDQVYFVGSRFWPKKHLFAQRQSKRDLLSGWAMPDAKKKPKKRYYF